MPSRRQRTKRAAPWWRVLQRAARLGDRDAGLLLKEAERFLRVQLFSSFPSLRLYAARQNPIALRVYGEIRAHLPLWLNHLAKERQRASHRKWRKKIMQAARKGDPAAAAERERIRGHHRAWRRKIKRLAQAGSPTALARLQRQRASHRRWREKVWMAAAAGDPRAIRLVEKQRERNRRLRRA